VERKVLEVSRLEYFLADGGKDLREKVLEMFFDDDLLEGGVMETGEQVHELL
jgi:hypothetical protein